MSYIKDIDYTTDDLSNLLLIERLIMSTMSSDDVMILVEDFTILHKKEPFTDVEYAHLDNQLDIALDEHLKLEYGT